MASSALPLYLPLNTAIHHSSLKQKPNYRCDLLLPQRHGKRRIKHQQHKGLTSMNTSKLDITIVTALTGLIVGGLVVAGMISALILGTSIAAAIIIDDKLQQPA